MSHLSNEVTKNPRRSLLLHVHLEVPSPDGKGGIDVQFSAWQARGVEKARAITESGFRKRTLVVAPRYRLQEPTKRQTGPIYSNMLHNVVRNYGNVFTNLQVECMDDVVSYTDVAYLTDKFLQLRIPDVSLEWFRYHGKPVVKTGHRSVTTHAEPWDAEKHTPSAV